METVGTNRILADIAFHKVMSGVCINAIPEAEAAAFGRFVLAGAGSVYASQGWVRTENMAEDYSANISGGTVTQEHGGDVRSIDDHLIEVKSTTSRLNTSSNRSKLSEQIAQIRLNDVKENMDYLHAFVTLIKDLDDPFSETEVIQYCIPKAGLYTDRGTLLKQVDFKYTYTGGVRTDCKYYKYMFRDPSELAVRIAQYPVLKAISLEALGLFK